MEESNIGYLCECCAGRFDKVYPVGGGIYLCPECMATDRAISLKATIALIRGFCPSSSRSSEDSLITELYKLPAIARPITAAEYEQALERLSKVLPFEKEYGEWSEACDRLDFERAVAIVEKWNMDHPEPNDDSNS